MDHSTSEASPRRWLLLLAFALNSGGNAFMFMDFVRALAHIGPACLAWSLCTLCAELPPYQAMTNAYS